MCVYVCEGSGSVSGSANVFVWGGGGNRSPFNATNWYDKPTKNNGQTWTFEIGLNQEKFYQILILEIICISKNDKEYE